MRRLPAHLTGPAQRTKISTTHPSLQGVSIDDDDMPIEVFTKLPREAGYNGDGTFNPQVWIDRKSSWDLISRLISD